jgi:hypothetical protein
MRSSMAIHGLEPYASDKTIAPDTLIKPFQARGIRAVVTDGGIQTTGSVTNFRIGRGTLVDALRQEARH